MTDDEINKAIAEAIGWKWVHLQEQIGLRGVLRGYPPNVECVGVNQEYVTDFVNDLNAMHEAEKYLDDEQWLEYMLNLQDVLCRDPDRSKWTVCRENMSATARQRAEAFLKTLDLWKE